MNTAKAIIECLKIWGLRRYLPYLAKALSLLDAIYDDIHSIGYMPS